MITIKNIKAKINSGEYNNPAYYSDAWEGLKDDVFLALGLIEYYKESPSAVLFKHSKAEELWKVVQEKDTDSMITIVNRMVRYHKFL